MAYPFADSHPLLRDDWRERRADRGRGAAPLAVGRGLVHPPAMPPEDPSHPAVPDLDLPPEGPLSDEPPMETVKHSQELAALLETGDWVLRDRPDVFFSGNISIFYRPEQVTGPNTFRSPDFFLVLGTDRRPRNSWVVWNEGGRYPDLIIELLSKSTRKNDLGPKKKIYQDVFRTPEYYAFDPLKGTLLGFELIEGRYHDRTPDARGLLWSEAMGHYLGVHEGRLRLFTRDGELVPTGRERGLLAEAAEQRAEAAEQRAKAAEQRADAAEQQTKRLMEQLRQLGIQPG